MNTLTKRVAQMTALYAAKKLWSQVDQDAAMNMMKQLYNSAPSDWELAARRAAGEGLDSVRSQATRNMDDVLQQVGLMRRSQVPSSSMSSIGLGVVGGVALTVAGGYFLYGTDAGKDLRRRMEERLRGVEDELETAAHNMNGDTVIEDPDAETSGVRAPVQTPTIDPPN